MTSSTRILALALLPALVAACGEPDYLPVEELIKPESCESCHPQHFEEWSGSMHAYAADDPVFLAMNARGQEETDGELGDFCVQCHAPMAVRTGATTDGLNLDDVPQHLKGVTCYFCHSVVAVEGTHNNPLTLADDGVMRGGIRDPVSNDGHRMAYSPLHDRESTESSALCGSCHDIVTPAGVAIERTFREWKESVFAREDIPGAHLSCGKCHMIGDREGTVADYDGVPLRKPKDHSFPGVDVALTPWPEKPAQLAGIERDLFGAVNPILCPDSSSSTLGFIYSLDNVFAGHMLPSGAAQDRRAWVEFIAYDDRDQIIFSSGVVADGQAVAEVAAQDPQLWQIRDYGLDESGDIAHMFWDVRQVKSELLPPAVTNDPSDPAFYHAVEKAYILAQNPARVTARMHMRPIGLDVIDDLIASGHLEAKYRDEIVTFTLTGTELEWRLADHGQNCVDRTSQ
ncbi:MAG: cytochrome c family protein [Proteobacteria bacterium]|nr:cytochrome c family protein [Pseudomonadota bacterium]